MRPTRSKRGANNPPASDRSVFEVLDQIDPDGMDTDDSVLPNSQAARRRSSRIKQVEKVKEKDNEKPTESDRDHVTKQTKKPEKPTPAKTALTKRKQSSVKRKNGARKARKVSANSKISDKNSTIKKTNGRGNKSSTRVNKMESDDVLSESEEVTKEEDEALEPSVTTTSPKKQDNLSSSTDDVKSTEPAKEDTFKLTEEMIDFLAHQRDVLPRRAKKQYSTTLDLENILIEPPKKKKKKKKKKPQQDTLNDLRELFNLPILETHVSESESDSDDESDSDEGREILPVEEYPMVEEYSPVIKVNGEPIDFGEFIFIRSNSYVDVDRYRYYPEREETCSCVVNGSDPLSACGRQCINRMSYEECNVETCPAGEHCCNQRLQRANYAPLKLVKTDKKGFGIRARETIPSGSFVIEYVGEMISPYEMVSRLDNAKDQQHFYIINMGPEQSIDATRKGNLARFINHSCNPNCVLEVWIVRGEKRAGIFAIRDILKGEEVTFDYQFQRYDKKQQKCFCGEPDCRGFLGAKPKPKPQGKRAAAQRTPKKSVRTAADRGVKQDTIGQTRQKLEVDSFSLAFPEFHRYSMSSLCRYIASVNADSLPDKARIQEKRLFLCRNIKKSAAHWANIKKEVEKEWQP